MSVGQGFHFTHQTRAQGTHTVPWVAILKFLTLAFHLLLILEPCTLFGSAPSPNAVAIAPTSPSIIMSLFLSFLQLVQRVINIFTGVGPNGPNQEEFACWQTLTRYLSRMKCYHLFCNIYRDLKKYPSPLLPQVYYLLETEERISDYQIGATGPAPAAWGQMQDMMCVILFIVFYLKWVDASFQVQAFTAYK